MPPVTRRRAKDAENGIESEIILPKESPRAKRWKSTGNNNNTENEGAASPVQEIRDSKQQKLSVRTREDESTGTGRKTHLEVEIPTSPKPKNSRTDAVPDSQDKEEKSYGSDSALLSSVSKQLEEEASQRLASSQSQSQELDQTPAPKTKGKHLVFDDDDDVENFVAAAAEVSKKVEVDNTKDEEEESDDDDAPEAVSTQAAAKEVQKSTQAALDAAEKQTANLKRKRQERDNLFKQQAEHRKRSRAEVQVHQSKRLRKGTASNNDSDSDGIPEVETAVTTGRRRAQKHVVPTHLPAEFLTDSSEGEDEDEADNDGQILKKRKKLSGPQPTKITFDDDQPKRPRDRVAGSTKYRVLAEQGDARLAPRARRDARVSKESLLKRKRVGVVPTKGTGNGKGFFVKR
ncbi:putative sporulation protein [Daldinia childiae]|uniref:putative sporulation protein n=1 Tax=Daldinia childiae TaxID=326645 RepID=UPI001447A3BD|nr:putative sporulation protein [Daldinia childiae]KAF3060013.1 putative sporulation protein [Daldinia childiae]